MFECLVCAERTTSFRYATMHQGDYIPLCSRRCRQAFIDEPAQFLPVLEDLSLVH